MALNAHPPKLCRPLVVLSYVCAAQSAQLAKVTTSQCHIVVLGNVNEQEERWVERLWRKEGGRENREEVNLDLGRREGGWADYTRVAL